MLESIDDSDMIEALVVPMKYEPPKWKAQVWEKIPAQWLGKHILELIPDL